MEAEVYNDWINATLRAVSAEDEIEVHVQAANDMRDVALQFQAERDRYRAAWLNARSRAKHADAVTGLAIERAEHAERKLVEPCGSCHPCMYYRDETWRAAGRKPPHVSEWDEARATLDRVREYAEGCRDFGGEFLVPVGRKLLKILDGEVPNER